MGKWDYREEEVDFDENADGIVCQVFRHLVVEGNFSEFDRLGEALENMAKGLTEVCPADSTYLGIFRKSGRSKPTWYVDIQIDGTRRMTKEEKAAYKKKKEEVIGDSERFDLASLRRIKARNPHLFDKI